MKLNKTCIYIVLVSTVLLSCRERRSREVVVDSEEIGASVEDDKPEPAAKKRDTRTSVSKVSGTRGTLVTSLTNNSQTSKAISYNKIRSIAESLRNAVKGSKDDGKVRNLQGLLSVQRMGGASTSNTFAVARTMLNEKLKKNSKASLGEEDRLNIAIAAVRKRQYAAAEIILNELVKSKNKKIVAAANNTLGVMESLNGHIPEAVFYWNKAIKAVSTYEAAHLNLGYTALKYGRYDVAKKSLAKVRQDWFATAGLSVAEFMSGNDKKGMSLCDKAVSQAPKQKATLYNCGVQAFMASGKRKSAEKYFSKAIKITGSSRDAYVDEAIYRFQGSMERQIAERREQEELRKIREAEERELRKLQKKMKKETKGQTVKSKPSEPSVDNLLEIE